MSTHEQLAAEAQAIAAEVEVSDRIARELRAVHEGIGRAAESIANGTVALLSLLPLVNTNPRALGFLSDAMEACSAGMRELLDMQRACNEILNADVSRLETLDARLHSVRAELLGGD